ncbi:hypothetical protein P7C70_g8391, partial [Phenoliferia sp. Uapishka_3]
MVFTSTFLRAFALASIISTAVATSDGPITGPTVNVIANSPTKRTLSSIQARRDARDAHLGPRAPQPSTNAERFKRGLQPISPTRRSGVARRATPSSMPCPALTSNQGTIAVSRQDNGAPLGFISSIYTASELYTFTPNVASAQVFQIPTNAPYVDNFAIQAVAGPDPANPFLGSVCGSQGCVLNDGQTGYTYFTGATEIPAGSTPSMAGTTSLAQIGYVAGTETDMFSINCLSLAFSSVWINADGSTPATTSFYYDPSGDWLGQIGDVQAFDNAFGDGAYDVILTFVPTV